MNKRKNRGGSVRTQRQRSVVAEGVYNNAPLMHATASQVGSTARITTASGQVWEGVFRTISPNFEVVLEVAARLENPDSADTRVLPETSMDRLIFRPNDIVTVAFLNVDTNFATRDSFQTDAAISARLNGTKGEEKELEPWDAGQINGENVGLELDAASNGWDATEMFRRNEEEYGVTSTFDHSLRGYTVPLQATDSPDFREAQAKADQIALEIENQPTHKARSELENGDEESAFAAVARPNQSQESTNGKYIPPAKRKGQNNGKLVRSTPPPSSGSSSQQNSPSPKDNRPPVNYVPHPVQQNSIHNNNQTAHAPQPHSVPQPIPQQVHQVPAAHIHNAVPQVVPPQMQNMVPPQHQQMGIQQHASGPSPPARPMSITPPHQTHQQPLPRQSAAQSMPHPVQMPLNKLQLNGDVKSGPRPPRHQQYQQERPLMQGGHPQGVVMQPQGAPYQDMKQEVCHPHQMPQQVPIPQQPRQAQPPPQRHEGPPVVPPIVQESLKDLQSFGQDFKLAPMQQAQLGPQMPMQQQTPQVPQNAGPESPPQQAAMVQQVQHSNSGSNTSINSGSEGQGNGTNQGAKPPSPSQSPGSIDSEKLQHAVARSKLNPNAKEFVLNPAAKPFQPRYVKSPSTPSASRPHTPQTPSHSPYIPATVSQPGGPPMQAMMMQMPYIGIGQPHHYQQAPPPPTNRIRKIPMAQIRPDVAQMQHAAHVTGQPLLAPGPAITQFIYPQAAAAHGMNQAAYQPAATMAAMHAATIRMYNDAAAAAAAASAAPPQVRLQYLPPQPSGTPTPAPAQYNPAAVQQQQGPPQGYQTGPPQAPPQIPMCYIQAQPHMIQSLPFVQQAPPPPQPHQVHQLVVHQQHPSQGGNPHGPNP